MIDLTGKRGLGHAVPRHWEYLAAEWGCGDDPSEVIGAAHAVENAAKISKDFCLNVVAGMLDVVSNVSVFCCPINRPILYCVCLSDALPFLFDWLSVSTAMLREESHWSFELHRHMAFPCF